MIRNLIARARAAAAAPVHPLEAVAGVALATIGTWLLQRYVAQQQHQLIDAYTQLRHNAAAAQRLAQQPPAAYPAPQDVDPLGRGDQVTDDLGPLHERQAILTDVEIRRAEAELAAELAGDEAPL